jgi:hypothetical protein
MYILRISIMLADLAGYAGAYPAYPVAPPLYFVEHKRLYIMF